MFHMMSCIVWPVIIGVRAMELYNILSFLAVSYWYCSVNLKVPLWRCFKWYKHIQCACICYAANIALNSYGRLVFWTTKSGDTTAATTSGVSKPHTACIGCSVNVFQNTIVVFWIPRFWCFNWPYSVFQNAPFGYLKNHWWCFKTPNLVFSRKTCWFFKKRWRLAEKPDGFSKNAGV